MALSEVMAEGLGGVAVLQNCSPDQCGFDGRGILLSTTSKFNLFVADEITIPKGVNYRVQNFNTGTNAYNAMLEKRERSSYSSIKEQDRRETYSTLKAKSAETMPYKST